MRSTFGGLLAVLVSLGGCKGEEEPVEPVSDCVRGAELQGVLDAAAPGDVVELCGGTHTGSWTLPVGVQLVADEPATLDGGGVAPVLVVGEGATVTLQGLTVSGGADPEAVAGGIDASAAAELVLVDTVVTGNEGEVGGVRGPTAGTLQLQGGEVSDNTGVTGGLAVFGLRLEGAAVRGNAGGFEGGGVRVDAGGSVVATDDSEVGSNTSAGYGGGAMLYAGATWAGGAVVGNSAALSGGGFAVFETDGVRIEGATVEANTSDDNGGGIGIVPQGGGTVALVDLGVRGNTALRGGGVHVLPGEQSVVLEGTVVEGNQADFGGGLYHGAPGAGGNEVVLGAGTSVQGNAAIRGAGIHAASSGVVRLEGATVADNLAEQDGGGVLLEAGSLVAVDADLGSGDLDNAPDDIHMNGVSVRNVGAGTTFTCEAAAQQCQ